MSRNTYDSRENTLEIDPLKTKLSPTACIRHLAVIVHSTAETVTLSWESPDPGMVHDTL